MNSLFKVGIFEVANKVSKLSRIFSNGMRWIMRKSIMNKQAQMFLQSRQNNCTLNLCEISCSLAYFLHVYCQLFCIKLNNKRFLELSCLTNVFCNIWSLARLQWANCFLHDTNIFAHFLQQFGCATNEPNLSGTTFEFR